MNNLCTTDNNCDANFVSLGGTVSDYQNLSKIANTTVEELIKNNPFLLIFPKVAGAHDDGIGEEVIFNLHGNPEQLEKVTLKTGNLMGFIGLGGTQLKIISRFSKRDSDDYFMQYMLQKVFSLNLLDYKYSTTKGGLDLLLFIFPHFLRKALAQGLFKEYRTFKRNDANIKGALDVSRHIRNLPFSGRIAYNSRERTFDNSLTELIRHTIEYIKTKPLAKHVLNADNETKKCVQEILEATQAYKARERELVMAQNIKPVSHPYYTAYKPLQKLCHAILRHEKIGYGEAGNKVYGILFDGAWLWEEYLWTILRENGFKHPQNKNNKGGIYIFKYPQNEDGFDKNHRRIYPDFYKENEYILDAKYKKLQNGVGREDLYQIVTYMHTMEIKKGGFLYPCAEVASPEILLKQYELAGFGGTLTTIGIPIPQKNTYVEFSECMKDLENRLTQVLFSGAGLPQRP